MMKQENKIQNGFTLIEIIVAMAIFILVISAITGIFMAVTSAQRKAFSLQNTQEAGRYMMESMIKEIRMSTSTVGTSDTLSMINPKQEAVVYFFDNASHILKRQVQGGQAQNLSPENIEVDGQFYIQQKVFPLQSLVTIAMKIKAKGSRADQQAVIDLQNTVMARGY